MVKLTKDEKINSVVYGEERTDDKKLKLKLKLKVWDKINQMVDVENVNKKNRYSNIFSGDNEVGTFLNKINKQELWELNKIVDEGICAKCGVCSIVCPNQEIIFDDYPYVTIDCPRKGHGSCIDVCPRMSTGSHLIRSELDLKEEYYSTPLFEGNSNKVINYILEKLVDEKKVDGAIFVGNYKWKPVSMIVTDKDGLNDTSKEQYAISALDAINEAAFMGLEKIVVVGLPCQIAGLRNVQNYELKNGHDLEVNAGGITARLPKIEYLISIFCKEKYEHEEMLNVLNKKGISIDDVQNFELTEHKIIVTANDEKVDIFYDEINPSTGCFMCKDFEGELADISIGDTGSGENESTVIIRTEKGCEVKKYLELNEGINFEDLQRLKQVKIDRFQNEIQRRLEEKQYNSYYYLAKYPNLISAPYGLYNIILPTPLAGYYNPDTVIDIAKIAKDFECDLKVTNRENFHYEKVQAKDVEAIMIRLDQIKGLNKYYPSGLLSVCPGEEHCEIGQIDTKELSLKCYEILESVNLNNKFKISIAGCPYPCVNYSLTDFGVFHKKYPITNEENCKGCDRCVQKCRQNAIEVVGDVAKVDYDKCIGCALCFKNCPHDSKEVKFEGYQVHIGGNKAPNYQEALTFEVGSEKEVLKLLKNTLTIMKNERLNNKERLVPLINRIGKDEFLKLLNSL